MRTGPAEYTEGLGEVVRGYRLYTGLSREGMAAKLGMALRSYERIEDGDRDGTACPPGLFDTLESLMNEFDETVAELLKTDTKIPIVVSTDPDQEWHRCAANRAAVEHEDIKLTLYRARRRYKHAAR
jgi:transcriptional regulator with XRE-family HTH domain